VTFVPLDPATAEGDEPGATRPSETRSNTANDRDETGGHLDSAAPNGSAPTAGGVDPASPSTGALERGVKLATGVIAPTTAVTALLLYYGYVSTTAEYRYFGLTLGTLGLSTQDLLLRSVAALYVPAGALLLLSLAGVRLYSSVAPLMRSGEHAQTVRTVSLALLVLGAAAMTRGVVGVVFPEVSRAEPVAFSALSFAFGIVAAECGRRLQRATRATWTSTATSSWSELTTLWLVAGLVLLSLFWATNSFAGAYGRGRAVDAASRLNELPGVILDTTDRLLVSYSGIEEAALPPEAGDQYRYRYRGFRLLTESNGRMFLLPEQWRRGDGATLVLPHDGSIRVQFFG
jgi:hypothetical protein